MLQQVDTLRERSEGASTPYGRSSDSSERGGSVTGEVQFSETGTVILPRLVRQAGETSRASVNGGADERRGGGDAADDPDGTGRERQGRVQQQLRFSGKYGTGGEPEAPPTGHPSRDSGLPQTPVSKQVRERLFISEKQCVVKDAEQRHHA